MQLGDESTDAGDDESTDARDDESSDVGGADSRRNAVVPGEVLLIDRCSKSQR